jgi:hypothetical protein
MTFVTTSHECSGHVAHAHGGRYHGEHRGRPGPDNRLLNLLMDGLSPAATER